MALLYLTVCAFVHVRVCLLQLILVMLLFIIIATETKIGTVVPKFQLKYPGEDAVFHCYSHSKPRWIGKDLAGSFQNHSTFILHNVQYSYTGNQTCLGTYENGSQFHVGSELVVAGKLYNVT